MKQHTALRTLSVAQILSCCLTALQPPDGTSPLWWGINAPTLYALLLQAELADLLGDVSARRVLMQLLNPGAARRSLPPEAVAVLDPPQRFRSAAAAGAAAPDAAASAEQPSDGAPADPAAQVVTATTEAAEQVDTFADDVPCVHTANPQMNDKLLCKQTCLLASPQSDSSAKGHLMGPSDQLAVSMQVPLGPSKKDPLVRRRELLGSGKGSLAARLLAAVTDAAAALLHGKNSGDLISEAVRGGSDGAPAALLSMQCCMLYATM